MRRLFSWTVFPVVLAGSVAVAVDQMQRGVSPALAFLLVAGAVYFLLAVLERIVPHQTAWNRGRGDVHVDLGHALVSGVISVEALRPLLTAVAIAGSVWLSARLGTGLWPQGWPWVAQLSLGLVIGEFFMYWIHRLTHEVDWLWRFHATHHSCPRLYFLNAARFHPVDLVLSYFSWYIPLVVLGAGPEAIALYGLVTAVHGLFQHANLEVRLGPLNWVLSMAELHRWHHSRILEEANTNFGQNLIVWDVVFGTRFLPKDRKPDADVGLTGLSAFPMSYFAQLASPFRWSAIKRASGESQG